MNKSLTKYQDEQSSPHQLHDYKSRGQSAAWSDNQRVLRVRPNP